MWSWGRVERSRDIRSACARLSQSTDSKVLDASKHVCLSEPITIIWMKVNHDDQWLRVTLQCHGYQRWFKVVWELTKKVNKFSTLYCWPYTSKFHYLRARQRAGFEQKKSHRPRLDNTAMHACTTFKLETCILGNYRHKYKTNRRAVGYLVTAELFVSLMYAKEAIIN